jgi:hypothetical protein
VVGKMEGGAKVPLSNDVSAASRDRAESLSSKAACFFSRKAAKAAGYVLGFENRVTA